MVAKDAERAGSAQHKEDTWRSVLMTYFYIVLWIGLSAAVILINKYVLAYTNFPYPVALTLVHMAFCSTLAFALIACKATETVHMDSQTYIKNVLPIAALFSGTLWMGNAAYLYLSVAFIQMLKAMMPITVFIVGVMLGTEHYNIIYLMNMVLVAVGVAAASYGELNFNVLGVIFQGGSIATESFRLVLIQILLQRAGIKLNPITTLYYIAPACFVFLCVPFTVLELPRMIHDEAMRVNAPLLLCSAAAAFALNMSVFLLIGKSSALTMNVAGVVKDWLLIGLSVALYKSPVSQLQLVGYGVAFLGVCWYNYQKFQAMKTAVPTPPPTKEEQNPLLNGNAQGHHHGRT